MPSHPSKYFDLKILLGKAQTQNNFVVKTRRQGVTEKFVSKISKMLHILVFLANSSNIEH